VAGNPVGAGQAHGNDPLENLLAELTEEDREAVLWRNAAAFFDIGVAAAS
jgi:hypothetical protein